MGDDGEEDSIHGCFVDATKRLEYSLGNSDKPPGLVLSAPGARSKVMRQLTRRFFLATTLPAIALFGNLDVRAAENAAPGPGKRVALNGYDPVSYFIPGRPEKGSDAFWIEFDDAVYMFRSAEHRAMFDRDPDRYAPQYSGYCAIGTSLNHKAEVDPESWAISNGKLYVFHYKTDMAKFATESPDIIAKADANWASVKGSEVFDHNDETDRAARRIAR